LLEHQNTFSLVTSVGQKLNPPLIAVPFTNTTSN
jgi:hypothetical protein